jgi:phospholipid transport system substrate-binding protein
MLGDCNRLESDTSMKFRTTFFASTIVGFLLVTAVFAGEPTEAIRTAVDQGVEILKNAKLDDKKQRTEVIDRLRQIVYPLFDFNEMAMRALGSNWRRLNAEQRPEFVSAFTALLEKTYADQIDLYKGQKVVFTGEKIEDSFAQVDSAIIDNKGQRYSVVYRLQRVEGKWKIYDIVVENISLVNNYRAQFNRVVAKSSVEELLKKIKQQSS